uniref:Secreted protein n=1 Tax=Globodera rostochiensis TaxID=31243 RepID=A0A914IEG4_GLORO
MNKFNWAHCVVIPLMVLNIVSSVSVHGGNGGESIGHETRNNLADLIAIEFIRQERNNFGRWILVRPLDSPPKWINKFWNCLTKKLD